MSLSTRFLKDAADLGPSAARSHALTRLNMERMRPAEEKTLTYFAAEFL